MKSTPSQHEEIVRQLQRHHIAKQLPTARINTLAEFLGNLDKVSESGDGWSARCPCTPILNQVFQWESDGTTGSFSTATATATSRTSF